MNYVLCALPCTLLQGNYTDISGCIVFKTSVTLVAFETVHFMIGSGIVVKVLCYKLEGRWFDPRWCHWNFSLT